MPCAQSLVSLLVTLPATLRVPRFRAVLIRLSLSVPVLGRLLTGAGLASDRWLSGGLLADVLGSRIGLTARV